MKKSAILFTVLFLIVALAGFAFWRYLKQQADENTLEASGTIETTEVEVGSRVGGRVIAVLAKEGDTVQQGDVLVRLDPYQIPAQRQELEAQLAQANAQLDEFMRGPRPQEIAAAEAQYKEAQARANLVASGTRSEEIEQAAAATRQAQADLAKAQSDYDRFQTLYNRHVVSQQEFENARNAYQVAQERVRSAQERERELRRGNRPQEITAAREQARAQLEQLRLLRAGTRPEEIEAQRAVIRNIEAQLQQLDEAADELAVASPCSCQVSSMDIRAGQLILANQTLATLTDLTDLWVRVYIPEERFGQVKIGDKAEVHVDAFANRTFEGTVVQLASRAEFTPRNVQTEETRRIQVFGVKVALNNTERLLRPGMPVDVTFFVNQNHK